MYYFHNVKFVTQFSVKVTFSLIMQYLRLLCQIGTHAISLKKLPSKFFAIYTRFSKYFGMILQIIQFWIRHRY